MSLPQEIIRYIEDHSDETLELLQELARIPAPSGHEEKRVAFCEAWLKRSGVCGVYTDDAMNVIIPFGDCGRESPVTAFLAHSDVVFPDLDDLPQRIEGDYLYGPGVGDNTVDVVHVLMAARYLAENKLAPQLGGVILVINSGEEGLGNLRGCRRIMDTFGGRMTAFYSLDGMGGEVHSVSVGSRRYRVEVRTEGGHSYGNFGNRNAIVYLASMMETLYQIKVPEEGKSTYNIGTVSGGTSVNTIAQQAEMLYEIRSDNRESLDFLDRHFQSVIACYRMKGIEVNVEVVGERPCMGDVDADRQQALADKAAAAVRRYFDLEIHFTPGSTDCNIPLSMGIPAVNTGCYLGCGTHTREEHIEISSVCPSQKVAFDLILGYFQL